MQLRGPLLSLPYFTHKEFFLIFIFLGLSVLTVKGGSLTISGRLINAETRFPVANHQVRLSPHHVGSDTHDEKLSKADGTFQLKVDLHSSLPDNPMDHGVSFTVLHDAGYFTRNFEVNFTPNTYVFDVGDVPVVVNSSKPIVESVKLSSPSGVYLRGLPESIRAQLARPTAEATINWNGNTPGTVEFRVGDQIVARENGGGPLYTTEVSIDEFFPPSPEPRQLTVVATSSGEEIKTSAPYETNVHVMSLPLLLKHQSSNIEAGNGTLSVDFTIGTKKDVKALPFIGEFGGDLELGSSFDYTFNDGSWEFAVGVSGDRVIGKRGRRPLIPGISRYKKPKLYIGNREISANVYAKARGSSIADPFVINAVAGGISYSWNGELTRYGLPDLIMPGLTVALSRIPGGDEALKNVSIIIWAMLDAEGQLVAEPLWPPDFKEVTVDASVGVEAVYEPNLTKTVKAKIYIGGKGYLQIAYPRPIFREGGFNVYGGVQLSAWALSIDKKWVLLRWPNSSRMMARGMSLDPYAGNVVASMDNDNGWMPMERPWRQNGREVFKQVNQGGGNKVSSAGAPRIASTQSSLGSHSDFPLIQNMFPESEPALVAGQGKMFVLYVRDTGKPNPLHFTEIAWSQFDGADWSEPQSLAPSNEGQFAPKIAMGGGQTVVAVWEQMKDSSYVEPDLEQIAARMEIASSHLDPVTGVWSPSVPLTNNACLDHAPQLAGPLANGDIILTWSENQANLLSGAPNGKTRILTRRWKATTKNWSEQEVLVEGLMSETSTDLAAGGNKAVFVFTRDQDGDLSDLSDTELYAKVWSSDTGSWGSVIRLTNNAIADQNAKVEVSNSGDITCVWQRDADLVMSKNLSNLFNVVRPDSTEAGFSSYTLSQGPNGERVVLWPQLTELGSDIHGRVFDPVSQTWSLDIPYSNNPELERSFSTAWDEQGNMVLAYANVAVTKETKSVTTEDGETVEITDVPQPGRVDLLLTKRSIGKDIAIPDGGVSAEGVKFLSGDDIILRAKVRNEGTLAVENVRVDFYDLSPTNAQLLIGSSTFSGWLKAGEEAEVSLPWKIWQPMIGERLRARTVLAVADPTNVIQETSKANNTGSIALNGVDFDLSYREGAVQPDGSARIVVHFQNLSPPNSPASNIRLRAVDNDEILSEQVTDPMQVGDTSDIVFDLPAGSHKPGARGYRVSIDDERLAGDTNYDNNEVFFSLYLWIDNDKDGLPKGWEEANGLSDDNALDAKEDSDLDGFTNYQEYLAGTDPNDRNSALRIGEISQRSLDGSMGMVITWPSIAGKIYILERSYDLENWVVIGPEVDASPPLNVVVDDQLSLGGKAFYRVKLAH